MVMKTAAARCPRQAPAPSSPPLALPPLGRLARHVLSRSDGAPIKLRRATLTTRRALPPGPLAAEIALWRREGGGWAVTVETRLGGKEHHAAWRTRTLGDAMDLLERFEPPVAALRRLPTPQGGAFDAALAALAVEQPARRFRLAFALLVGEALADWSRLAPGLTDAH